MIKGILQKLIRQKLGQFIKNLTSQQLKTDLFGGSVTMTNIQLNEEYFNDQLKETFLQMNFSSIGKLFVQAPLTKLSTVPVTLILEDIYVLFQTKNCEQIIRKDLKSNNYKQKLLVSYIKKLFEKMMQSLKPKSDEGYLAKIMNRVIDNLTIRISNVHARIENYSSDTNQSYCTGVTIQELSLQTADQKWQVRFVDRYDQDKNNNNSQKDINQTKLQKVRKLINIKNFSWYWQKFNDNKRVACLSKNLKQKYELMKNIFQQDKQNNGYKYKIQLISLTSQAKILINPQKDIKLPLYELSLNLQPITINIQQQCLHQMVDFINGISLQYIDSNQKSNINQQTNKLSTQISNINHKQILQKITQQVVSIVNQQKQLQNIQEFIVKKFNSSSEISNLIKSYHLQTLVKYSQTIVKNQVIKIKQKKLKKQTKGWFSKQRQLTQKEKLQLQQLVESTFVQQISAKRPKHALFIKLSFLIEKLQIKITNKLQQNIIFQLNNFAFQCMLTKDVKYCQIATTLASIELYYLSQEKLKTSLIKNFNSSQIDCKLITGEIIFQQKSKTKSTKIKAQMTKILINYEHFLMKKIFDFAGSFNQNKTKHLSKLINDNSNKKKINSGKQQINSLYEYLFEINMEIISPTILLPIQQTQYIEMSNSSKIQKKTKQCWAFDFGALSIKKLENTSTHSIELKDLSLKHYKTFNLEGQFSSSNQCTYSFVNGLTILGTAHVSDKKQLDLKLSFQMMEFFISYTEYKKICKIFKLLKSYVVQRNNSQKQKILLSSIWQGPIRKKQYKIQRGYIYIDYWAILTLEKLYLYSKRNDIEVKQQINLKGYHVKNKELKKNQNHKSQISARSSQISQNDIFYTKLEIVNDKKSYCFKISNTIVHEFEQKIIPLLSLNEKLSFLDQIVEQVDQNFIANNKYQEQEVFQDFDDNAQSQKQVFQSCIREKQEKLSKQKLQQQKTTSNISSSSYFSLIKLKCQIQQIMIVYQQDHIDQKMKIKSVNKNDYLYQIWIKKITMQIINDPFKKQTVLKLQIDSFKIYDYIFLYRNKTLQCLLILQRLNLDTTYLENQQISNIEPNLSQNYMEIQRNNFQQSYQQQFIVNLKLDTLTINWKPDVFLEIIHFFNSTKQSINQGLVIKNQPISKKHVNQINIDHFIQQNPQFWQNKKNYDDLSTENKFDSDKIFIPCKNSRLSLDTFISQIQINFMHRQSHVKVFKILGNDLYAKVELSKQILSSQVLLKDLKIIDTTNYPQNDYPQSNQHLNEQFVLFGIKQGHEESNLIQIRFVKHENEINVCNDKRINSAINISIQPVFFYYFQQPILRIIDYALVQVLTLLTDYNLIQANESLKSQISKLYKPDIQKQRTKLLEQAVYVLFSQYQELLKKILHPLFMNIQIVMKQPQIILKANKQQTFSIYLQCQKIIVQNRTANASHRVDFQKINSSSISHVQVYEQIYQVNLVNSSLFMKQSQVDSAIKCQISNVFEGVFKFDKLMNQLELQKLYPTSKLTRDYNCSLKISPTLTIPQMSRITYQNLLKIANYNLTYDDGQDEKFIHNYQISKLRDPNLINFSLIVPLIDISCCYDDPNNQKKRVQLMNIKIGNIILQYHRNKLLDSEIKVNFDNFQINYNDNSNNNNVGQKKLLLNYSINHQSLKSQKKRDMVYIDMMKKDNSKVIIVQLINLQLFINFKIISSIKQFFNVQKWVYPLQKDMNSLIQFHCELQNSQIYLLNQNIDSINQGFLIKGRVYFQYKIKQTFTFQYVQRMFKQKLINQSNISEIGQCTNLNLRMWVSLFYFRQSQNKFSNIKQKSLQRKILDSTQFAYLDSLQYGCASSEKQNDIKMQENWSQNQVMIVSDVKITSSIFKAKISLSDYLLLQKLMNKFTFQQKQSEEIIKCFNKVKKNINFVMVNKSLDQIYAIKPKTSPFSSIQMQFEGISLFVYDIKFNPIIQFQICDVNLFKKKNSLNGKLQLEGKYFNDDIFVWQPFLQNNKITVILQQSKSQKKLQNDQRANQYFEFNVQKQVRINFTRQLLKSLINFKAAYNKYSINKNIQNNNLGSSLQKIKSQITPLHQCIKQIQFVSHYIIRNQTGYPIRLFSNSGKQVSIIMSSAQFAYPIDENYQKSGTIIETVGFQILHEKYQLQTICGVSFQLKKKIKVKIKTVQNKSLNDSVTLETYCKSSKKVLLIASAKYIKDYTTNTLIQKYIPFDNSNNIELNQPQKVKASFYDNEINKLIKSEYIYKANNGCLEIKHPKIVYNYTPIPLQISQSFAMPGQFVGISGPLRIQGIPYQNQQIIKIVCNKQKRQYYLYTTSYIIDYTGTLQYKFNNQMIQKYFKYEFTENKRKITIYLLSDINQNFYARWEKQQAVEVQTKLGRQTIELRKKRQLHMFNVFCYLTNIETSQIKQLKKVIEVTQAMYLVNQTNYDIMLPQNNYKNQVLYLKKSQKKPYYWQDYSSSKQFQICPEIPQYGSSCFLNFESSQSFMVPHISKDYRKAKIFSLVCQTTDNIDFIVIQQCQKSRYEVINNLYNTVMSVYLTFEQKQKLFQLKYEQKIPLGFINNQMRKQFYIEIKLLSQQINQGYISQKVKICTFERDLFEKDICLRPDSARQAPLKYVTLSLTFENKTKCLKLVRQKIKQNRQQKGKNKQQKQQKQVQMLFQIPKLYISLIGNYQQQRKQLFVLILQRFGIEVIKTKKAITYSVVLQSLRLQNIYKRNPYYEIIAYSEQSTKSKCFMKFVYSQSLDSPNLIYYLGFSMRHLIITATSQEIEVFIDNLNDLMREKSLVEYQQNNFIEISYDKKVNPSYLANPNDFLYFVCSEIYPLKVNLTFKNVSGWGGVIMKAFGNLNDCGLQIDGKVVRNIHFPNFQTFFNGIENHFKQSLRGQLFSIVGSLTLLSTPLNLASKIKTGFQDFLTLPAKSYEGNPLDIGKGVALGTGSLLKNTFQGIFEGAQSIGNLIGNGISMTITDQDFNKKRAELKNKKSSNVIQGLGHGVGSVFNGLTGGITGLITQPIKGAQKKGFGGFMLGGLKGITGLVTKPVTGIIDGVTKTAEGIKNTTKVFQSDEKIKKRTKTYQNRPFYGIEHSIRSYDRQLAYWNYRLQNEYQEDIHEQFVYINVYKASMPKFRSLVLLITPVYTFIVDSEGNEIKQMIKNSDIKKLEIDKKQANKLLLTYEKDENNRTYQFLMPDAEAVKSMIKDVQSLTKPLEYTLFYRIDK